MAFFFQDREGTLWTPVKRQNLKCLALDNSLATSGPVSNHAGFNTRTATYLRKADKELLSQKYYTKSPYYSYVQSKQSFNS